MGENSISSAQIQPGVAPLAVGEPFEDTCIDPPLKKIGQLEKRYDISWSNLSYRVYNGFKRGEKKIIKNMNGSCRSGELMAIMGPSGAGKSSLLNILAGYRNRSVTGTVSINEQKRDLKQFRKISSYVLQDEYMPPFITVMEAVMVSANLNLPETFTKTEKLLVVNEILEKLNLTKCLKTLTKRLSGGEHKRLSIAIELIRNPPMLFVDEPTSGLDSASCFHCVNLLRELATEGHTVMCSIHQPSAKILEMFDTVYYVAEGTCIYFGSVGNVIPFLKTVNVECPQYHNPADILMDVALNQYGYRNDVLSKGIQNGKSTLWFDSNRDSAVPFNRAIVQRNRENKTKGVDGNCIEITRNSVFMENFTSFNNQFKTLYLRSLVFLIRNPLETLMNGLCLLIYAILIGFLYLGIGDESNFIPNNVKCLSTVLLTLMYCLQGITVLTFNREMKVFVREHLNCWYEIKAFYLARTLADLPIKIFTSTLFATTVYFMSSQPHEVWRFFMYIIIVILYASVAQVLGYLYGAAFDRLELSILIAVVTGFWILIFAGIIIHIQDIPGYLRWISDISYGRYAFEGVVLAVYGYDREEFKCEEDYCSVRFPREVVQVWGFAGADIYFNIAFLVLFIAVVNVLTYLVLHIKISML